MSASEETKRAWVALGIAEVAFAILSPVGGLVAILVSGPESRDEWMPLSLLVAIVMVTGASLLVGLPVAVHTVGRLTERLTRTWRPLGAGLIHLVVGLGLGVLVAVPLVVWAPIEPLAAVIAFVLPGGLAAWVTRALVPVAVRHRWVAIVAWALAALAFVASVPLLLVTVWGIG
ncbi:hypothetical protein [Demequina lutea]|uniref:Uncharacterized protein n=1 Tax=Demequina lutea TaxID=431489 RepID=A0A7Y9Z7Y6_9MICO|nr:hypothetical protein [Demequina lutea]NYI39890.1 hypothetical protein [Demequina lutea]